MWLWFGPGCSREVGRRRAGSSFRVARGKEASSWRAAAARAMRLPSLPRRTMIRARMAPTRVPAGWH